VDGVVPRLGNSGVGRASSSAIRASISERYACWPARQLDRVEARGRAPVAPLDPASVVRRAAIASPSSSRRS
jgi:hypothetical protein